MVMLNVIESVVVSPEASVLLAEQMYSPPLPSVRLSTVRVDVLSLVVTTTLPRPLTSTAPLWSQVTVEAGTES